MNASRCSSRLGLLLGSLLLASCQGDSPPTATPQALSQERADSSEARRVWIVTNLDKRAEVADDVRARGGSIHHDFPELSAIAATLPEQALRGLEHNPNIEFIEEDAPRYPLAETLPYGIDKVQARAIWDVNNDGVADVGAPNGTGRKVCIIDSGLYTGHSDLPGATATGSAGNLAWNQDGCGHGTHVAGTIAAVNDSDGVVGVTPGNVALHIVRVFRDDCAWAYSSDLVAAAEQCRLAGANVINMSLGGGGSSTVERDKFAALNAAGILSIAAAGNAGNTTYSYPASYPSVVSVAAVDSADQVAGFSQKNDQVDIAAPGVGVLSTVPWLVDTSVWVDANTRFFGSTIEFSAPSTGVSGELVDGGLCNSQDAGWAGRAVLCQRGEIPFFDKVMNVQQSGGVAAVIYNNAPGGFSGTLGAGNTSAIPALGISQEDGLALQASHLGKSVGVVSYNGIGSGYEAWDGTSMATPHVAGVAALIWSGVPSATNAQVREALEKTAKDLGTAGRDNAYGFGLVQAKAALDYLAALPPPPPPDTTAPVISGVASAKVKANGFRISWNTNEASNTVVTFTKGATGTFTNASMVTTHTMSFSGVKGRLYQYFVSSTDAAGNKATSGPHTHQN